ncbi:hypothetical protein [Streptomyces sp. NPDC055105]|uniref:hypothetical protein n=1 Tax=Streptomyces sp. NPDC055105 TaxID=3365719 RepID=UPI0037D84697
MGTAIERYSHEYRRPRGVYLSVDNPEDVEQSPRATGLGARSRWSWRRAMPREQYSAEVASTAEEVIALMTLDDAAQ